MKRFLRCALPLPCLRAVLLLCIVFTAGMNDVISELLIVIGFLTLLACTFGYWAAFSRRHPGERLPRIPTRETGSPDISRWAVRFWGWFLGNLLLWCEELVFSYICYTV